MSEPRSPRVVVGVSASLAGLQALRYAVSEARRRQLPLHAVRAWCFDVPWKGPDVRRWADEIAAEALRYIYDAFDAAMGGLPADVDVTVDAPEGRPDRVLTDLAGDGRDLLVLGGRAGGRRLSWVIRGCTRLAAGPITLVPPPELARAGRRAASTRNLLREAEHCIAVAKPNTTGAR